MTSWLREALGRGAFGEESEGGFPRFVWFRQGDDVYEGRLVNSGLGEYKGYLLQPHEWPKGLDEKWAE